MDRALGGVPARPVRIGSGPGEGGVRGEQRGRARVLFDGGARQDGPEPDPPVDEAQ